MSDAGLTGNDAGHAFYRQLAEWWPLISPLEDYEQEASFVAGLLAARTRPLSTVLELGSGGGHCAYYLKSRAELTLVDLSAQMLEVSKKLNPECRHLRGDMRTVRLGAEFDAVFVHDAIDYMTTEHDLRAVFETAALHCRPGGLALFCPDDTRENFTEGTDHGGVDGDDGRAVRYLEWSWDPDPQDSWVQTEYCFVLRDAGGVRHVHESHRTGLFSRHTWLGLLAQSGFRAEPVSEELGDEEREERPPRELFLGVRL